MAIDLHRPRMWLDELFNSNKSRSSADSVRLSLWSNPGGLTKRLPDKTFLAILIPRSAIQETYENFAAFARLSLKVSAHEAKIANKLEMDHI